MPRPILPIDSFLYITHIVQDDESLFHLEETLIAEQALDDLFREIVQMQAELQEDPRFGMQPGAKPSFASDKRASLLEAGQANSLTHKTVSHYVSHTRGHVFRHMSLFPPCFPSPLRGPAAGKREEPSCCAQCAARRCERWAAQLCERWADI